MLELIKRNPQPHNSSFCAREHAQHQTALSVTEKISARGNSHCLEVEPNMLDHFFECLLPVTIRDWAQKT